MKSRIAFVLSVVVTLAVAAVLPVRGPVAAQEEVGEGPVGFLSYDFCTGDYTLEVLEGAPTEGTATVEVDTLYGLGTPGLWLIDSATHDLDWADPQEMSGTLSVAYPEEAVILAFAVWVDDVLSDGVSIRIDELVCEEPGDGEEPVDEEPVDEQPVDEQPVEEAILPGCDVTIPLEGAVVGRFVHTAETYWAPDFSKKTEPEVLIPWNTTLWTFGVDESGQFRKVVLNCTYLWVPVETMGPNFDEVWGGTPLPMTVVE